MNKDLNFEHIEEFVDYVIKEVEKYEGVFVAVIAKFDEAKEILKNVMTYEDINFESLQIESPIMDNYDDAFVLSFWMNDGVLEIGCEKLKDEDGDYTDPCGDVVYLFDNCNSKIIPMCECSDLYFINIEDDCDYDEECDEYFHCDCRCGGSCVEYFNTDDGDLYGFTASKSTDNGYHIYSFHTSDSLSESDIHDILKELGF